MPPQPARFASRSSAALLVLDAAAGASLAPAAADAGARDGRVDAPPARPATTRWAAVAHPRRGAVRHGAVVSALRGAAVLLATSFALSFAVIYTCLTLMQDAAALLPR